MFQNQGRYPEADPLYQRSVKIMEKTASQHPNFATGLENYASLLREMGREAEAEVIEERAKGIRAKRAASGA